jgi:hypothetical protein
MVGESARVALVNLSLSKLFALDQLNCEVLPETLDDASVFDVVYLERF